MTENNVDSICDAIKGLMRSRILFMKLRIGGMQRLVGALRGDLQRDRGQDEEWSEDTLEEAKRLGEIVLKWSVREYRREQERIAIVAGLKVRRLSKKEIAGLDHPLIGPASWPRKAALGIGSWQIEEERLLDEMERLAGSLPVQPWLAGKDRRGFSLRGLAVIVGHAGNLSAYPDGGRSPSRHGVGCLWKRFGLAPYEKDGVTASVATWRFTGGLKDADWIALGYSGSRLGDVFGKVTQPLMRAQWRGDAWAAKAEEGEVRESGPLGPYGEAYGTYKAEQTELNAAGKFRQLAEREAEVFTKKKLPVPKELQEGRLTKAHINARALRFMTKLLIADLWSAWREASSAMEPRLRVPLANPSPNAGDEPARAANDGLEPSVAVPPAISSANDTAVAEGQSSGGNHRRRALGESSAPDEGERSATKPVESIRQLPSATSSADEAERSASVALKPAPEMPSAPIPVKAGKRRPNMNMKPNFKLPAAMSSGDEPEPMASDPVGPRTEMPSATSSGDEPGRSTVDMVKPSGVLSIANSSGQEPEPAASGPLQSNRFVPPAIPSGG